jgi:hypothetical protein
MGCHGNGVTAGCLHHTIILDGTGTSASTKGRECQSVATKKKNEVFVRNINACVSGSPKQTLY